VNKLPIATFRRLSKVVCLVGAMAVASPLFVSDFRVTPDNGDAFWDGLLAAGGLGEPAKVEDSNQPSVELMLSDADLGRLVHHPGMVEMWSPYSEFMADESAAGRTNRIEERADSTTKEQPDNSLAFDAGAIGPHGGYVGGASAGGLGAWGPQAIAGFLAMHGVASGSQASALVIADDLESNGRKTTTDVSHERSLLGEPTNGDSPLETLAGSPTNGDSPLETLAGSPTYSSAPTSSAPGLWAPGSSPARWNDTTPWVHGGGGPGNNNSALVPGSLLHDVIDPSQPNPAIEQIVFTSPAANAPGGDIITLADVPSALPGAAPAEVPEPGTVALFGLGLAFLGVVTWRRRQ